MDSNPLLL